MSEVNPLGENERERLIHFQAVSGIEDEGLAVSIMAANNWNLEAAVNSFMGGDGSSTMATPAPSAMGTSSLSSSPPPRLPPSSSSSSSRARSRSGTRGEGRQDEPLLGTSRGDDSAGGTEDGRIRSLDAPLVVLPTFITNFFKAVPHRVNRDRDARKFANSFRTQYGHDHPVFFDGSYSRAVTAAFRHSKFLLVFLHSPLHDDADRFVDRVLKDDDLRTYMNENTIMWAGQVCDAEAYELSTDLGISSYPCMAFVVCQSERAVIRADCIEGVLDPAEVLQRLRTCAAAFQGELNRMQQETARREQDALLREQQNQDYLRSEQEERERREEQRRRNAEQKVRADEERLKQEREAAAEADKVRLHAQKIEDLRHSIGPEPAAGPDVTQVRLQLPDGRKVNRRFQNSDKVQAVVDFLAIYFADNGISISNFAISTSYPKKTLENFGETMDSAGLSPRAMLMVQDLDA